MDKLPNTWYRKIDSLTQRGIPDFLICCNGIFAAWELKTEEGITSTSQSTNLELIRMAKGHTAVVTPSNLEKETTELLKKALKNRKRTVELNF